VFVRDGDFSSKLCEALKGRPLDLVLDAVGGSIQKQSFNMLAPTGRLVAYGASVFASHIATPNYLRLAWYYLRMPRYHTLTLIESNKSLLGFNLIWLYSRVTLWREMLTTIQALQLKEPSVGAAFPFAQLKDAVRMLQSGKTTGKVVVTV
jgi:alcohol dehydrogenase